jgi:hypothetical protein
MIEFPLEVETYGSAGAPRAAHMYGSKGQASQR